MSGTVSADTQIIGKCTAQDLDREEIQTVDDACTQSNTALD